MLCFVGVKEKIDYFLTLVHGKLNIGNKYNSNNVQIKIYGEKGETKDVLLKNENSLLNAENYLFQHSSGDVINEHFKFNLENVGKVSLKLYLFIIVYKLSLSSEMYLMMTSADYEQS